MQDDIGNFNLSTHVKAKLKNKELLKKELEAGKTAQDIMEISDENMAKFYRSAYRLFEGKRYSDASNAFFFLATLNPYNHDYWLGLGMSLQLGGNYEPAIDAYEMAAICEIDNPVPYFYLAKCLFAIHDRESALQALEMAIEYSEDKADYQDLAMQAKAAKSILIKNQ